MNVILSLSGGMDSAVLLWYLLSQGCKVHCLSVNYGQRHHKELQAADSLIERVNIYHVVRHTVADISCLQAIFGGSSQTSNHIEVPEGHYTDESMKLTVVPNRNMVLLSLATALAVSTKSDAVAYAAHAGDHAIYPDCRPEFTEAMAEAMRLCDWRPIKLLRPFLWPVPMSKTVIAKLGQQLGVPFERTWSCYKGQEFHCGKCGTCVERREAFREAGIEDPTTYLTDHRQEV